MYYFQDMLRNSTWHKIAKQIDTNFNITYQQLLKIYNATSKFCGLFTTKEAGIEAITDPTTGEYFYQGGTEAPWQVWVWDGTAWVDGGTTDGSATLNEPAGGGGISDFSDLEEWMITLADVLGCKDATGNATAEAFETEYLQDTNKDEYFMTVGAIIQYLKEKKDEYEKEFFRKDKDDESPYTATFGDVNIHKDLIRTNASGTSELSEGNLKVQGTTYTDNILSYTPNAEISINGNVIIDKDGGIQHKDFIPDILTGQKWRIDHNGDAEMESLTLRSFLEVPELRYNRVTVESGTTWNAPGAGLVKRVGIYKQEDLDKYLKIIGTDQTKWSEPQKINYDTLESHIGYHYFSLKLEKDEVGSFVDGDICMGIWHFKNENIEDVDDTSVDHSGVNYSSDNASKSDEENDVSGLTVSGFCRVEFAVLDVAVDVDEETVLNVNDQTCQTITNTYTNGCVFFTYKSGHKGAIQPQMTIVAYGNQATKEENILDDDNNIIGTRNVNKYPNRTRSWYATKKFQRYIYNMNGSTNCIFRDEYGAYVPYSKLTEEQKAKKDSKGNPYYGTTTVEDVEYASFDYKDSIWDISFPYNVAMHLGDSAGMSVTETNGNEIKMKDYSAFLSNVYFYGYQQKININQIEDVEKIIKNNFILDLVSQTNVLHVKVAEDNNGTKTYTPQIYDNNSKPIAYTALSLRCNAELWTLPEDWTYWDPEKTEPVKDDNGNVIGMKPAPYDKSRLKDKEYTFTVDTRNCDIEDITDTFIYIKALKDNAYSENECYVHITAEPYDSDISIDKYFNVRLVYDGTTHVIADLTNQMDSFFVGSDKVYQAPTDPDEQVVFSTQLQLFDGNKLVDPDDIYFGVDTYDGTLVDVTSPTADGTYSIKVLDGFNVSDYDVVLTATYPKVGGSIYSVPFHILALASGRDGESYRLRLSYSAISMDENGDYPNLTPLTIDVVKSSQSSADTIASSLSAYNLWIEAYIDGSPRKDIYALSQSPSPVISIADMTDAAPKTEVIVNLFYGNDIDNLVLIDTETIPVVKDGSSATGYIADLTNEFSSVACDEDLRPILSPAPEDIHTNASLCYGVTTLSSRITVSSVGSIYSNGKTDIEFKEDILKTYGISIDGIGNTVGLHSITISYHTHTPEGSTKQVYKPLLNPLNIVFNLLATNNSGSLISHNGVSKDITLTIQPITRGNNGETPVLYSLQPSANSIKKKNDGTIIPSDISCTVLRSEGTDSTNVTIANTGDTPPYIYYRKNDTDSWTRYSTGTTLSTSDITSGIQFRITSTKSTSASYTISSSSILYDTERIPLLADGADGVIYDLGVNSLLIHKDHAGNILSPSNGLTWNIRKVTGKNRVTPSDSDGVYPVIRYTTNAGTSIASVDYTGTIDTTSLKSYTLIEIMLLDAALGAGNTITGNTITQSIISYVSDGSNATGYIADLDNEMSGVACDNDYHPTKTNATLYTTASVKYEGNYITSKITSISAKNGTDLSTYGITYSGHESEATSHNIIFTIAQSSTVVLPSPLDVSVNLECVQAGHIGKTASCVFTIMPVLPGADGSSPKIYELVPLHNDIKVSNEGVYVPVETQCSVTCTQGDTVTPVTIAEGGTDNLHLYYMIDDQGDWIPCATDTNINVYTKDTREPKSNIRFMLRQEKDGVNKVIDRETLPVHIDAADGFGVFTSYIFTRSINTPTVSEAERIQGSYLYPSPAKNSAWSEVLKVPVGETYPWSDNIPSTPESYPVYMMSRVFSSTGKSPQQEYWQGPYLLSDSDSFDVCYHPATVSGAAPDDPSTADSTTQGTNTSTWHDNATSDDVWMATRKKSGGTWSKWAVMRINGESGCVVDLTSHSGTIKMSHSVSGGTTTTTYHVTDSNGKYVASTGIYVSQGVEILTIQPENDASKLTAGYFTVAYSATGCEVSRNGADFHITRVLSEALVSKSCSITFTITVYGQSKSIIKTYEVALVEDGVDGNGVEYVFYAPDSTDGYSETNKPTLHQGAKDTSDRLPADDEYLPRVTNASGVCWTDEPTGVATNRPIEFYSQRKKINGTWQNFSPVLIWNQYTTSGSSPYLMDLSNEVTAVPIDASGNVKAGTTISTSDVYLFLGSNYAFSEFKFYIETSHIDTVVKDSSGNEIPDFPTSEATAKDDISNVFTLCPTASTMTSEQATITVVAVHKTNASIQLRSTYTINKSKAGADAVVYELMPDLNIIHLDSDGHVKPDYTSFSVRAKKISGSTTTIIESSEFEGKNLKLRYKSASAIDFVDIPDFTTQSLLGSNSYFDIALTNNSNAVLDRERIHAVKDGDTGPAGKGFDEVKVYYTFTSSNSTAPASAANIWHDNYTEAYQDEYDADATPPYIYLWKKEEYFDTQGTKLGESIYYVESGKDGETGKSAYEIALENGFEGTEAEWLASLKGEPGIGQMGTILRSRGNFSNKLTYWNTNDWLDWVMVGTVKWRVADDIYKIYYNTSTNETIYAPVVKDPETGSRSAGTEVPVSGLLVPDTSASELITTTDHVNLWSRFSDVGDYAFHLMLADSANIDSANMGEAFIGKTSAGTSVDASGNIITDDTTNGWLINAGQIRHTQTGLTLTSDGYLYDPIGLHFKVASIDGLLNDYLSLRDTSKYNPTASGVDCTASYETASSITFQGKTYTSLLENHKILIHKVTAVSNSSTAYTYVNYTGDVINLTPNTEYTLYVWIQDSGSSTMRTEFASYVVGELDLCQYSNKTNKISINFHVGSRTHDAISGISYTCQGVIETYKDWSKVAVTFTPTSTHHYFYWIPKIQPTASAYIIYAGAGLIQGSASDTRSSLLDTGIDIANRKITLTADQLECYNNSGDKTMWLNSNGDLALKGVLTSLMQVIDNTNRRLVIECDTDGSGGITKGVVKDGEIVPYDSYYSLDILNCGGVIRIDSCSGKLCLPYFISDNCYVRTLTMVDGTKRLITADEMKSIVGKKILVIMNMNSSTNPEDYGIDAGLLASTTEDYGDFMDYTLNGKNVINQFATGVNYSYNRGSILLLECAIAHYKHTNSLGNTVIDDVYYWKQDYLDTANDAISTTWT